MSNHLSHMNHLRFCKVANWSTQNAPNLLRLMALWLQELLCLQKICSSNSSAASGICDASKFQAQHYLELQLGSTLKYLNINHYHHHLNSVVNPFAPNAPFLYPLKTSENHKGFQGLEKGYIGNEWVNCKYYWQWSASYSVCSKNILKLF